MIDLLDPTANKKTTAEMKEFKPATNSNASKKKREKRKAKKEQELRAHEARAQKMRKETLEMAKDAARNQNSSSGGLYE